MEWPKDADREVSATVALDPRLDFAAGTVAGMAAIAVGFPFDTVKVRLQSSAVANQYKSTFHALATILRKEHVSGLYRGIASPLVTAAPLNGLVFSVYRFLTKIQLNDADDTPSLTQVTLAGAGTGFVGTLITTPTELIKTQQQLIQSAASTSTTFRPPSSAGDVVSYVLKHHGVKGLYRGVSATAWRDAGYGPYFAAYEATIRFWPRPAGVTDRTVSTAPWYALLCAGAMAGVAGWIVTFPFDVVKTRVQSTFATTPHDPYRSTLSTIVHSYRNEGLRVFFRGLSPTLIRSIPVNMVTFTTFEAIVHTFS
ncbi:hypothetical protein IEO21_07492 [Rhodonia placenta]|uniref:Mitochondrial carrier n=1 Tax=Rhodonia placenta TaxID=104341 RepID=A0A8H7U089_9APHY|nr:hypothetical protein IEO21_07492 [Postia placenta]